MNVFNITLIVHFMSFLLFIMQLAALFPNQEKQLHSKAGFIGLTILVTGILLVIIKYPQVNLYKIIPKSILFITIAIVCGIYSGRGIPNKRYYLLIAMTVLASLIA